MECDRTIQGMAVFPVEPRLFQREVPFGRAVRVVDQHKGRIMAQSLRLLDHGLLILTYKARTEEACYRCDQWHVVEDIPCGDHIDAAGGRRDRRDRGEAGEPLLAAANRLPAPVRQHKVDGRGNWLAIDTEQFVRCAVA